MIIVYNFQQTVRRSSLFYNASTRHVHHGCNTSNTSAIRMTRVQQECYTNDTRATRVKNFDFDNDTSENIFSHPYISYRANEILQEEEQLHSKNYLLSCLVPMPKCV